MTFILKFDRDKQLDRQTITDINSDRKKYIYNIIVKLFRIDKYNNIKHTTKTKFF